MSTGKFISFEGPEASGKSTQIKALIARLEKAGYQVISTREPGGTPTGEIIRDLLQHDLSREAISARAEVLLFSSSRAQLVQQVIRPALEGGCWVISDRFFDSTTAYQGYGRGFPIDEIDAINVF